MRYKRDESFRYEFGTPLSCEMKIVKLNDQKVDSNEGQASIHDISPSGMKLSSELDLLSNDNEVEIEIRFSLSSGPDPSDTDSENIVAGKIIWQKPHFSGQQFYGVELLNDDEGRDQIIDQLKEFTQQEKSTN